jgi:hypothetical protein
VPVQANAPMAIESVALAPSLWLDPDVRWLTGVHEAEGRSYVVRERYEELLWWLLLPALLKQAGEPVLDRAALEQMGLRVDEAMAGLEKARYRVDFLLKPGSEEEEPPVPQYRRRKTDKVEGEARVEATKKPPVEPRKPK